MSQPGGGQLGDLLCKVALMSWVLVVPHRLHRNRIIAYPPRHLGPSAVASCDAAPSVGAGAAGITQDLWSLFAFSRLRFGATGTVAPTGTVGSGVDHIGGHRQQHVADHQYKHYVGCGHQFEVVHRRGRDHAAGRADMLRSFFNTAIADVPAVERQQRQQVDGAPG